jgi:hypothetical protein
MARSRLRERVVLRFEGERRGGFGFAFHLTSFGSSELRDGWVDGESYERLWKLPGANELVLVVLLIANLREEGVLWDAGVYIHVHAFIHSFIHIDVHAHRIADISIQSAASTCMYSKGPQYCVPSYNPSSCNGTVNIERNLVHCYT